MSDTVYFIEDNATGHVKIGYTSRTVNRRKAEGQTFNPGVLSTVVETYGTLADEGNLHHIFYAFRVHGEWFRKSPLLEELIWHLYDGGSLQEWIQAVVESPMASNPCHATHTI